MRPNRSLLALAVALAAMACGDQSPTRPTVMQPSVLFAKPGAILSSTYKLPLADAGLSLRSDRQFIDATGTYSVYEDGVCTVANPLFYNGSGDANFSFTYPQTGRRGACGRTWTVVYPDAFSETLAYQGGLQVLQNASFRIAIGDSALRHFRIGADGTARKNPTGSRCGLGLVFGEGGANPAIGSDSVWVRRVDASTWRVHSQTAPANQAYCIDNGLLYEMQVDFVIASSQPLP